jgi:hypothetical protein
MRESNEEWVEKKIKKECVWERERVCVYVSDE